MLWLFIYKHDWASCSCILKEDVNIFGSDSLQSQRSKGNVAADIKGSSTTKDEHHDPSFRDLVKRSARMADDMTKFYVELKERWSLRTR